MTELRRNILFNRWVLTGALEKDIFFKTHTTDAGVLKGKKCFFCEKQAGTLFREIMQYSEKNEIPWEIKVLEIKDHFLRRDIPCDRKGLGVYDNINNFGSMEIVVETPTHTPHLQDLSHEQISKIFKVYQMRIKELEEDDRFQYVIMTKNEKAPTYKHIGHTHSYLIGLPVIPKDIKDKLRCARDYFEYKERCVFCDIIQEEMKVGKRIVEENGSYLAFVPFAPMVPFEVHIYPKRHNHDMTTEGKESLLELASILKSVLKRLSNLLKKSPIAFVINSTPFLRMREGYWHTIEQDYHWHVEIIPEIRGMGGYELGAGCYIEPLGPEICAEELRNQKLN